MEDVGEVVGHGGKIRLRHVEPKRPNSGGN
jgi:hypothetical protein